MTKEPEELRAERYRWLQDYVERHMTPAQLAKHTGFTRSHIYGVLNGRNWLDVPRPEGFEYPWSDQERPVQEDDPWKAECLADYVKERMTPVQFAEHIGCTLSSVYLILLGKSWIHVPRPEGFEYPWPECRNIGRKSFERREQEYREAVACKIQENWTYKRLARHLKVSVSTAHAIVKRCSTATSTQASKSS